MNYYLGLFTPYTWLGFREHGSKVVGFSNSVVSRARKVQTGDIVIAYLSGLTRWCGAFQIRGEMYRDSKPLFSVRKETFVLRFPIRALAVLDPPSAIPVDVLWSRLLRTRHLSRDTPGWAVKAGLMSSLGTIDAADGRLLVEALSAQASADRVFEMTQPQQSLLCRDAKRRMREQGDEESVLQARKGPRRQA